MRVLISENKQGKRLIKAQGEEMGLEDWKTGRRQKLVGLASFFEKLPTFLAGLVEKRRGSCRKTK